MYYDMYDGTLGTLPDLVALITCNVWLFFSTFILLIFLGVMNTRTCDFLLHVITNTKVCSIIGIKYNIKF